MNRIFCLFAACAAACLTSAAGLVAQGTGTGGGGAPTVGGMPNECCERPGFEFDEEPNEPRTGRRKRPKTPPEDEPETGTGTSDGGNAVCVGMSEFVHSNGASTVIVAGPKRMTGLMGMADLYQAAFRVTISPPSWDGGGGVLFDNEIPVPDVEHLEEPGALQPRPGTMPGMYIYCDTDADAYYQYGGPLDLGANPQETAWFTPQGPHSGRVEPMESGSHTGSSSGSNQPLVLSASTYRNQLSGSQLVVFRNASPPYIEVRHVDGTVARFERVRPTYQSGYGNGNDTLWHLVQVRDGYDNIATYHYDSATAGRLLRIEYPSGLHEKYDYAPSWDGSWPTANQSSSVEITYMQDGIAIPGRTWGMVFDQGYGGTSGSAFGGRLAYTIEPQREILLDQGATPYAIDNSATVSAQVVRRIAYQLASGGSPSSVSKYQGVHTGTPFLGPLVSASGTPELQTSQTTFLSNGRAASRLNTLNGGGLTFAYPLATRSEVGVTMIAIAGTDSLGGTQVFETGVEQGRLFRAIDTPSNDYNGRPRFVHSTGENASLGGPATTDFEPEKITTDHFYDGSCSCRKPIETRYVARRAGVDTTRVEKFEYYPGTKLLKKYTKPNPATGLQPAEISWSYSYIQAKTGSQIWGAWLPRSEQTPDGTYEYVYSNWQNRRKPQQHGRMAGTVERRILGVRTQNSLTGSPVSNSSVSVGVTITRNLSSNPAGVPWQGPLQGMTRRVVDGDGIVQTTDYTQQGWVDSLTKGSGQVRTRFDRNTFGNITRIHVNHGSSHVAVYEISDQDDNGRIYEAQTSSGGVTQLTEYYYDRFGNLAASRRNNLASDGNKPGRQGGSSSVARDWIENQYHYQGRFLMEAFIDRQPVDEAVGAQRFARTEFEYDFDVRLGAIVLPNGSRKDLEWDGYGSIYREILTSPDGAQVVLGSKTFVNPFVELTAVYEFTGTEHLVTLLTRNAAGAVTQRTDPESSSLPAGYTGAGGGPTFQYEVDAFGRTIETRAYSPGSGGSLVLEGRAEVRYDELGRHIWTHDEILGIGSGDVYTALHYAPGKSSQILQRLSSGLLPLTYDYDALTGFLRSTTLGGDVTSYEYFDGTAYIERVTKTSADAVSGQRVTSTAFDVDPFGRITAMRRGSPELVTTYAYNSVGQVDFVVDPMQRVQTFLHDGVGRVIEHGRHGNGAAFVGNLSVYEDFGYGDGRTKVTRIDGIGNTSVVQRDFAARVFIVQHPGGDVEPTAAAMHQSNCLFVTFDEAQRVSRVFDGDGGETRYWYNGLDELIQRELVKLGGNIATANTKEVILRDALGRVSGAMFWGASTVVAGVPVNDVLMGSEHVIQDSLGRYHAEGYQFAAAPANVLEVLSSYHTASPFPAGIAYRDGLTGVNSPLSAPVDIGLQYDGQGRIEQIDWNRAPGGSGYDELASYGWAGATMRSRTVRYAAGSNPHGYSTYDWDQYDRLRAVQDTVTVAGGASAVMSRFDYVFDASDNLRKEIYAKVDGSVGDRHAYGVHGRLEKSWMGVNQVTMAAAADPAGFDPAVMHEELTYGLDDAQSRQTTQSQNALQTAIVNYAVQNASHSQGPSNRYDTVGAPAVPVTHLHDERGNLRFDGRWLYRYDFRNRLQEIWAVQPVAGPLQVGESVAAMNPGAFKKAVQEVIDEVPNLMGRVAREHMSSAFRQQLRVPLRGGVMRLASAGGEVNLIENANLVLYAVYGYDPLNRRVQRVVVGDETTFHTYDGWKENAEYAIDGSNNSWKAVPRKQFFWGADHDELIAMRSDEGDSWATYYVLRGGQNTAAKLVDDAGRLVEQYEYDPFGRVTVYNATGGLVNDGRSSGRGLPFLWKSIRLDSESGLLYMRNRYYSTDRGRFLSKDPLGVSGDRFNWNNLYAYVGNRPLSYGDAMGTQTDVPNGPLPPVVHLEKRQDRLYVETVKGWADVTSAVAGKVGNDHNSPDANDWDSGWTEDGDALINPDDMAEAFKNASICDDLPSKSFSEYTAGDWFSVALTASILIPGGGVAVGLGGRLAMALGKKLLQRTGSRMAQSAGRMLFTSGVRMTRIASTTMKGTGVVAQGVNRAGAGVVGPITSRLAPRLYQACQNLTRATGGIKQWIRIGTSYNKTLKVHTFAIKWGAGARHVRRIKNLRLRAWNRKLRQWQLPFTMEAGHLHLWILPK